MSNKKQHPFCRYSQLTEKTLNVELQVHTNWTDGKGDVATLLALAQQKNLGAIAFTEHVRHTTDWFDAFAKAVREGAKQTPDLVVYLACEAKALDTCGTLDVNDDILHACEMVLGSVHTFPKNLNGIADYKTASYDDFAKAEFELALGLVMHAPIHVLAHPGGMSLRKFGRFPDHYYKTLMQASLQTGVAIEINSSYMRDIPAFLDLCREIDPVVSIGSDVHDLEDMARCRDEVLKVRNKKGDV
jgi:putative hydrolase